MDGDFMFGSQTGSYFACPKKENKSSLPGSHKQQHTQGAEGQVELRRPGNGGSRVRQGDNTLQIILEDGPDTLCHRNEGPHRNAFQYE